MIFRRENRGESFQRQISNLRKQQDESASQDEEQPYDYDSDEAQESDDPADTSRYATDEGTPAEGISFPPAPAEPNEQPSQEATLSTTSPPPPAGVAPQETQQWQAPAVPSTPSLPTADATTSTIARNTYWNGTLRSEGALQVHGRADGELYSETDLFVAEGAEVDASLHADSVVVAGLVRGKIEARSRLEILPQGEVTGDVRAPKLVVHEGATISGQLKMEDVGASSSSGAGAPSARGESRT